jgi:isopentenyldiphosphate isomerase
MFEEYELDYILFGKVDIDNSEIEKIKYNKDEVKNIKFVDKDELDVFRKENRMKLTPWFKLILNEKKGLYFSEKERQELKRKSLENTNLPIIKFGH